jgi:DNA topoisomerase IB
LTRRRRGRGFSYHDAEGRVVDDPGELERIRCLVIPPAWRDVWICRDPRGHIQATGTDAAGRRQYLYHPVWRRQRGAAKFDHVLEFAATLPRLRRRVSRDLAEPGLSRTRVLGAAARLLDLGAFRVGGEAYAVGDDATFGLATLRRDHVSLTRGEITFRYLAKGGAERSHTVVDDEVHAVLAPRVRRRTGEELLAYREGGVWRDVRSADINDYLRDVAGLEVTAKDFRTWHATNLAAVGLASVGGGGSRSARKRAVSRVMREVADFLGNTPAVARASYVDPRVVDLYHEGVTIPVDDLDLPDQLGEVTGHTVTERRVLRLLRDESARAA